MLELSKWRKNKNYKLKPSLLLKLNRIALEGVHKNPGVFRSGAIKIRGSRHEPPTPEEVPELIEQFCDYINDNFDRKSAIHLASFAMWRLNWIHPFADGNGRTSRIVSYLILCAKLGNQIPGVITIPEQIAANKKPYYDALEACDQNNGATIDVTPMEKLLDSYLANQLVEVHEYASGKDILITNESKSKNKYITLVEGHPVITGGIITLVVAVLGILFTR